MCVLTICDIPSIIELGALCLEDTKVYEDPLVQYDHGLNIPWHVGKVRYSRYCTCRVLVHE